MGTRFKRNKIKITYTMNARLVDMYAGVGTYINGHIFGRYHIVIFYYLD